VLHSDKNRNRVKNCFPWVSLCVCVCVCVFCSFSFSFISSICSFFFPTVLFSLFTGVNQSWFTKIEKETCCISVPGFLIAFFSFLRKKEK
jgi:hypothetical protein